MAKITSIEDCIVTYKGERRCVYCGATLADGEVCACANFGSTCTKLAKADQCQEKVNYYADKKQAYLDSIKPPKYEFRMAFVRVEEGTSGDGNDDGGSTSDSDNTGSEEPPAESDGGEANTEGGE